MLTMPQILVMRTPHLLVDFQLHGNSKLVTNVMLRGFVRIRKVPIYSPQNKTSCSNGRFSTFEKYHRAVTLDAGGIRTRRFLPC